MSRLYDVNLDEKRWKVHLIDEKGYPSYKFIDKDNDEIYTIYNIIGVEQVSEDELMVYQRYSWDDFQIIRYRFGNGVMRQVFEKKFSRFEFLTDDRILFTYCDRGANQRISGVYSISENKMLEETDWLKYSKVDSYIDENDEGKKKLLIEKDICSLEDSPLMFIVDSTTLEPNSSCYSSFRNKYIDVNSKEDIIKIEKEDKKLARMISDFIFEQQQKRIYDAKEKIKKNI